MEPLTPAMEASQRIARLQSEVQHLKSQLDLAKLNLRKDAMRDANNQLSPDHNATPSENALKARADFLYDYYTQEFS